MVGHGSSDNAASYGVYAFGLLPGWTALRDSISLSVYYGAEVDVRTSTVLGLSQSGQTPDVLDYVERARARGAFTVALTNDPASELAVAAEAVLPLEAGPERAIAATKTYLNTVAALALLAGYAAGRGPEVADGIRRTAALLEELLPALERRTSELAVSLAFVGPDVRNRPRPGVRNRARDLAQAARDVPGGSRAADRDRPPARSGSCHRLALPGLDDRLGGRGAARRAGGGGSGARGRRDADRERGRRQPRSPARRTTFPCLRRRWRC